MQDIVVIKNNNYNFVYVNTAEVLRRVSHNTMW